MMQKFTEENYFYWLYFIDLHKFWFICNIFFNIVIEVSAFCELTLEIIWNLMFSFLQQEEIMFILIVFPQTFSLERIAYKKLN